MTNILRVSTKGMSREEWLVRRKKTIGGSDAAAIVGLSAYASPYSVWADKTGRVPDKPDNEAMRQGRDLEDYVARRFMEATGKRVRRENAMLYNPLYPYAHADVDRMIIGEDAGLECKTTSSLDLRQFKGVEFPEKYYTQCVHYMAVTGAARWYLAVLVFGRGFFVYVLERDQAEIDALMAAEASFWKNVEEDIPPSADGTEATSETLQVLYSESDGSSVELYGRDRLLDEYFRLRGKRDEIDDRIAEIENTIKDDLGSAERGACGDYSVSWKSQQRKTFAAKAFAADHPEIDLAKYYSVTVCRPFKVALKKNEQ